MTTNTNTTHEWIITTSLAGAYLAEGEPEAFEATTDEALSALLDEAAFQLDATYDDSDSDGDEDEVLQSDLAYVESLRGFEGRGDLLFTLERDNEVSIKLESFASGFGGVVTLTHAE